MMWRMCEQPSFHALYVILVVFDLVLLCYVRYPNVNNNFTKYTILFHTILNVLFFVETILKLLAYGFRKFVDVRMNIVDALVTLVFITAFSIDMTRDGYFFEQPSKFYWTK